MIHFLSIYILVSVVSSGFPIVYSEKLQTIWTIPDW